MNSSLRLFSSLVLLLGCLGPRMALAAWPPEGAPLSTAGLNASIYLRAVSDGAGGAIVVFRSEDNQLYGQRIDSTGVTGWGSLGVPLGPYHTAYYPFDVAADGAGGAFVAWSTGNILVQHLAPDGSLPWGTSPVVVCPSAASQSGPLVTADGSGGAIVAWSDGRPVNPGLYAQRLSAVGALLWPAAGVHCGLSNYHTALVADGLGGAYVAWTQAQGPQNWVRVSRVHAGASAWARMIPSTSSSALPAAVSDGANGVIVAWENSVQRMDLAGNDLWAPGGVVLASSWTSEMVQDGAGGAVVVNANGRAQRVDSDGAPLWSPAAGVSAFGTRAVSTSFPLLVNDASAGPDGFVVVVTPASGELLYAQRLDAAGSPQWLPRGIPVIANSSRTLAPVGDGGAIVFFADGTPRAMRLLPRGCTPPVLPGPASVEDVPNDQGGWARVVISAPSADVQGQTIAITGYAVWRQIPDSFLAPPPAAPDAVRPMGERLPLAVAGLSLDRVQAAAAGFPPGSWESAGYVPAVQLSTYKLLAPTRDDWGGEDPVDETFIVTAHTNQPDYYTIVGPATGYSVDNLVPAGPQNLSGDVESSLLRLSWSPNQESDFSRYAVYRGDDPSFVPGPGNRLGSPNTPEWTDAGFTASSCYKVSAIDRHDNESPFTALTMDQVAGVRSGSPSANFLAVPAPNPARERASADFGLSRAGRVKIEVFGLDGARVRTLIDASVPAGVHRATWDLATERGAAARPGVYLLRMTADGTSLTRRLVVRE